MVSAFDRIILAVPIIDAAVAEYAPLLGVEPRRGTTADGVEAAWLGLGNTVIELQQQSVERAHIRALVCTDESAGPAECAVANCLQLALYRCDGREMAEFRQEDPRAQSPDLRVDHLVLRTADAAACIELFAAELGIRLALDHTVPEWGGRMLFFRAGKMTLEVIESEQAGEDGSTFWGLALQCRDIDASAARLRGEGVAMSDIRVGRKPGTRVATLHSHCLGIPTLLLEPAG